MNRGEVERRAVVAKAEALFWWWSRVDSELALSLTLNLQKTAASFMPRV